METSVLISIIVSTSSVFIAVATNIVVWMIKVAKIEEKVDHTDKKVDVVDKKVDAVDKKMDQFAIDTKRDIHNLDMKMGSKIEEVRQENREEIKEVRTEIKGLGDKVDVMTKEISFIRGAFEALLKGEARIGFAGGDAMPSMVQDAPRKK